jgi:hypothetical protein
LQPAAGRTAAKVGIGDIEAGGSASGKSTHLATGELTTSLYGCKFFHDTFFND